MIRLFNYLLISNIFTGGFVFYNGYFDFYLNYIFMAAFLLAYVLVYKNIPIPRNFIYILGSVLVISVINVFLGNNSMGLLLKVAIGFLLNGITYYLLIRLNDFKVEVLFRIYMQIACVIAGIGIFQEISYLAGFNLGYDYRYFIPRMVKPYAPDGILRITSIMQEPSHFGNVMAPALFIAILNIIKKQSYFISKKMSYLLLLSVILTFSLVAYFSIIVVFILILLNYRKAGLICVSAMIVSVFMFSAYRYLPDIKMRVDQTISVISNKSQLGKANLSTYSFVSNGLVALKSFQHNPLFGSGIGSHPLSYDKYIAQVSSPDFNRVHINREDAGSLFFRIVSETGLLGVFLTLYFIFRFYVSKKKDQYYWVISNAILCLLILNLLRQGNYFYLGFMFFVWAYYFTGKNVAGLNDGKSP